MRQAVGFVPCAWGKRHPLADAVRLFAPVLAVGGVIIADPRAAAPGAAFALCELSARSGALAAHPQSVVFADMGNIRP
jgi:acyl-CoA reductase-like NAD-dependent aldehyde dehydrogenase